jgi:tRNA(Ile)-lysidine synthase
VLEGKVVRPFLSLTRAEVERELEKRKLAFRVDSSNGNLRFRRNRIRIELLPLLEREFNPEIVRLLKELADRNREDEAYLERQARALAQPWQVREARQEKVPLDRLLGSPPALARRILRQMIMPAQGTPRGLTHKHVEALLRFAREAQSGRNLILPNGVMARKQFDWLAIGPHEPEPADPGFSYLVSVPGEVFVPQLGIRFRFKIVKPRDGQQAYNQCGTVALNPLKPSGELRLRSWRSGDRFRPFGSRKTRKLKEFFRERRIPLGRRRLWPVLENGKEILWVRGLPPAYPTVDQDEILLIEEETPSAT